jgi:hypothetical protein
MSTPGRLGYSAHIHIEQVKLCSSQLHEAYAVHAVYMQPAQQQQVASYV